MIINYPIPNEQLQIGRPYTFRLGRAWYMRVGKSDVVFLGSPAVKPELLDARSSTLHIKEAVNWPEFRYATCMEIK